MNNKITVKQYSIENNITVQAVYQKIKSWTLKSFKKWGKTYVLLNDDIKDTLNKTWKDSNILMQNLKQENEILKVKIEEKDKLLKSKDDLIQAKDNENKSLLIATQTMKQLQEKQDFKQIEENESIITWKRINYLHFFSMFFLILWFLILLFIFLKINNGAS